MSEPVNSAPRHQYEAFLRQLPADWDQQEITQLGAVVGGSTPSREVPSFWRGAIPWVTPGEVSGGASKLLHDTQDHISPSGLAGSGAHLLPAGSLLVTTRATLGARVINAAPMATNQGFKSIVFKKPEEASYYYHLFEKVKPELVRRASGTTFLEISGAEFGSIKVPSPSPDEKLKIAQLLDTLDTTIHQTEAIVEKLKQVKQGLLHDLLTRGVDANGKLRPSYEEAPERYKELLGRYVPLEWDVDTLAQSCSLIRDGTHLPPVRVSSGPLLLSVRNMKAGKLVLTDQDTRVSESFFNQMHRSWSIQKGDILLAIVGATIGKVAQVGDMPKFTLQRSVAVLRGKNGELRNDFMFAYLGSHEFQTALWGQVNQTAQPGIYLDQLGSISIPLPPDDEQKLIVERLSTAECKIYLEEDSLEKLKKQKRGLMDDLLTGRVRVTPLLAQ